MSSNARRRTRRNVIVNIETDDGTHAYRARLIEIDHDRALGFCEGRSSSGIPTGFYPLKSIFNATTREPLG